jgi:hypothetical protein
MAITIQRSALQGVFSLQNQEDRQIPSTQGVHPSPRPIETIRNSAPGVK